MVSINFKNVYINEVYSLASLDEYKGNIKNANKYIDDLYYGEKTYEAAEIKMQKEVLSNLNIEDALVIGGDLSNQLGNMNYTLANYNNSFLGIYSACSSFIESLILASIMVDNNINNKCVCLTSSHVMTSERQFRYPNEYGSLKSIYTTVTMTGAVGAIVSNKKSKYKIINATIGKVIDYKIKDASNIGAIMAPGVASTINSHLYNNKKTMSDYDLIITGDLGELGLTLLKKVLANDYGILNTKNIIDAGSLIYKKNQNKYLGASGPTVLPFYLFNKVFNKKDIKRILVCGSGSLHNPTLVNQKFSIPSISHVIELEVDNVN